jgi:aldose 1-epimerase
MNVALNGGGLTVSTTLVAGGEGPVPVSFGFHPYFGLPGAPRTAWRLETPAMRRLGLDAGGLPDGSEEPFGAGEGPLGARVFDDLFVLEPGQSVFGIAAEGRRIAVEFLEGYRYAQVYAPPGQDFIAFEPMTAPTNALVSGRGLHVIEPGGSFVAVFRVRIGGGGTEEVGRGED